MARLQVDATLGDPGYGKRSVLRESGLRRVELKVFLSHRYESPEVNLYFHAIFAESAQVQFDIDPGSVNVIVDGEEQTIRLPLNVTHVSNEWSATLTPSLARSIYGKFGFAQAVYAADADDGGSLTMTKSVP
jgi:hypothetical protein